MMSTGPRGSDRDAADSLGTVARLLARASECGHLIWPHFGRSSSGGFQ